jgi:hypothetical protein
MGLSATGPSEETLEKKKKARAARERRARARENDDERYDGVVE